MEGTSQSPEDARLENYTLGPPLETYGPNARTVSILVVIGRMFCGFAYAIAADVQGNRRGPFSLG